MTKRIALYTRVSHDSPSDRTSAVNSSGLESQQTLGEARQDPRDHADLDHPACSDPLPGTSYSQSVKMLGDRTIDGTQSVFATGR